MRGFTDWFDEEGFYAKDVWDIESNKWIHATKLQLFPFQRDIFEHVFTPDEDGHFKYSEIVLSQTKKSGKAISISTPILTVDGWTSMGDIEVGDYVFNELGHPVEVTFVSEVMENHPCFRVTFTDDSEIIADAEHLWTVGSRLKIGNDPPDKDGIYWSTLTTEAMYGKEILPTSYSGKYKITQHRFILPKSFPVETREVDLPIAPYTFGLWLGDGSSGVGQLTIGDEDLEVLEYVKEDGFPIHQVNFRPDRSKTFSISEGNAGNSRKLEPVNKLLRSLGVLGNKHIPEVYLMSSIHQRMELLQGLMDSDGYVSVDGRCEFTSVNKDLADGFYLLLASLGIKGKIIVGDATLDGRFISEKYRIHFQAYRDNPVFKLKRKVGRLKDRPASKLRSENRRILSIVPVPSEPVKCIQVDSPAHLYLAGKTLIPTHNTLTAAMLMAWAGECGPEGSEIYSVANDQDQAEARAFTDLEYHTRKKFGIIAANHKITFGSGTTVIALAQHYSSAAGSRPLLSVVDELWAVTSERGRRMWAEMTPPPSVEDAMRVTVTYAGYEDESNQLLEIYNLCFKKEGGEYVNGEVVPELAHIVDQYGEPVCRRNGRTFIFWDTVHRMPWQTDLYYSSQLTTLRPADFMRMHLNRWASSSETFIPIELFDESVKDDLLQITQDPEHKFRNYPLALAVDIGPKHDTSAVVGTYYDFERKILGVACHKIFIPPESGVIDIEATVEAYVSDIFKRFHVTAVLFDPYQFYRSAVTLQRKGIPVVEFPQTAGNMIGATEVLYEALRSRHFECYRSDELRDHLRYASAETSPRGSRLMKGKHAKYPIDAAVALAMSSYYSVKFNGVEGETEIEIPSPFSDVATLHVIEEMERLLPPELRSSYE